MDDKKFTICAGDCVTIDPVVPQKRPVTSKDVQTDKFECEAKDVQFPEKRNAKVQTELKDKRKYSTVEFEPEALLDFLNRVTPTICSYLEMNAESHAFDHYTLLSDTEATATRMIHCLRNKALDPQFCTSCTSWNSTGTVLAVGYSVGSHKDWCYHDSVIAVWSFNRKTFNELRPNSIIECDCCVTSISFHSDKPALIAGGKFNGEVFVCDISKEDDVPKTSSGIMSSSHREPITNICWSKEDKEKIISCSLDGKILIWRYRENKSQLELTDGFIVLAEDVSRNLGIKSVRPEAEVGVTCMTINSEDPSIFIVGTEGGGIFQCSFNSAAIRPYFESAAGPLKSPIVISYDRHPVYVTSVQFSPFSRNIFLSCGTEGEIRIYTLLQTKPLIRIHFENGIDKAQWSPVRPLVIAAITSDGQLHLFDLSLDLRNPVESIKMNEENKPGCSLMFNSENSQLLSSAAKNGETQVWTLGNSLITVESDEAEQLTALLKSLE